MKIVDDIKRSLSPEKRFADELRELSDIHSYKEDARNELKQLLLEAEVRHVKDLARINACDGKRFFTYRTYATMGISAALRAEGFKVEACSGVIHVSW